MSDRPCAQCGAPTEWGDLAEYARDVFNRMLWRRGERPLSHAEVGLCERCRVARQMRLPAVAR